MQVAIHTNPGLKNQIESAAWVAEGFRRHGITVDTTPDRYRKADVQVVQGPWYCLDYWQPRSDTARVIWLNRCFYGDGRFDLSLGWLRPDGSRDFRNAGKTEANGTLPELKPEKTRHYSACYFADYGRDPQSDISEWRNRWMGPLYFRPHPQQPISTSAMTLSGPLADVWALCDTAIGHSTTTLVEARINGLQAESSDPLHVVHGSEDREPWLTRLSWAQWNHEAIKRGEFWEHLQ